MLAELDAKHALLVKVAVFCAFRPSELLALKWTDFDNERKMFTISGSIVRGIWRPYTKTTNSMSRIRSCSRSPFRMGSPKN